MKNEIMTKASRLVSNTGLKIKKYSPEILMVTGIAGTVVGTVMACKATTKLNPILAEAREEIDAIHKVADNNEEYTEKEVSKALTISYTQTAVKLVKLYAPAAAVTTVSITSILAGHHILKKRNIAIAAAYAVVDKGFKDYRKRVVERFGDELDKELRYNIQAKEIETEVTNKKGETTTKKEIINTISSDNDISDYARFFDETCTGYTKDAEYNLMLLRRQQDYANEQLKSRGHLYLNEVYDMLGIQRTKAGQQVGWVYDPENGKGDNYVDFNIYNGSEQARLFVNGYEKAILLDFNVDGVILDLM